MNAEEKPTPTPRLNFANPAASTPAPEPELEPETVEDEDVVETQPEFTPHASVPIADLSTEPAPEEAPETAADGAVTIAGTVTLTEVPVEDVSAPEPTPEAAPVAETGKPTVSELEAKKAALEAEIAAQKAAEKASVIDQIKTVVKSFGISTEELVEALGGLKIKRKGVKAKPKFRDPATGALWSGRGKAPLWIRDKDYDTFRIPAEEAATETAEVPAE